MRRTLPVLALLPMLSGCWSALGLDDFSEAPPESTTTATTTGGAGGVGGEGNQGGAGGQGGAAGGAPPSYSDLVMEDEPVGYWRLGEVSGLAANEVAGGPNGSLFGDVIRGVGGVIEGNGAYEFSGDDGEHVSVSEDAAFDFQQNLTFSLELWFKIAAWPSASDVLLARTSGSLPALYGFLVEVMPNGNLEFVRIAGLNSSTAAFQLPGNEFDAYHHVVAVYDSITLYLYYDGFLGDEEPNADASIPHLDVPITIGGGFEGNALFFTGVIDEVAIYPGILTEDRIVAHYCAVVPTAPVCP